MRFQPKTQEQIDAESLCADGVFPFTIKKAEEAEDKNGNGFFKLKLFVHDNDRDWHVYDNVSPNWMAHKLLHLCEGTGLGAKYQSGNLSAEDLIDRQGHCEITMEEAGKYPAKNVVVDYEVRERDGMLSSQPPVASGKTKPASEPATPESDENDIAF